MIGEVDALTVLTGDCIERLRELPDDSVQCCVTSPPYYGLRDYCCEGQIGLEDTPDAYVSKMVEVFREVRRVLRPDGTCWVNLGDCYARNGGAPGGGNRELLHMYGKQHRMTKIPSWSRLKPKDLVGMPWRVAFALQADGWWLRQDIIWHKPNPMPESVTDRCTKAHEYIFLLTKSAKYFYDAEAVKEPANCGWNGSAFHTGKTGEHQLGRSQVRPSAAKGSFKGKTEAMADTGQNAFRAIVENRNRRSVWTVATAPYSEAHFATFPPDLIKPCVMAGSKAGDTVLDPFGGSGTTGMVALELGRRAILIELNPKYVELIRRRCDVTMGLSL